MNVHNGDTNVPLAPPRRLLLGNGDGSNASIDVGDNTDSAGETAALGVFVRTGGGAGGRDGARPLTSPSPVDVTVVPVADAAAEAAAADTAVPVDTAVLVDIAVAAVVAVAVVVAAVAVVAVVAVVAALGDLADAGDDVRFGDALPAIAASGVLGFGERASSAGAIVGRFVAGTPRPGASLVKLVRAVGGDGVDDDAPPTPT